MINKYLARSIIQMAKIDQKIRKVYAKNPSALDKVKEIDRQNQFKMKEIIRKNGWPTMSLVGKKASHRAWLLIQHADSDVKFQEYCLELMRKTVNKNGVLKSSIAFLTDRVLVNRGKPQLYGTQFYKDKTGRLIPREIHDTKNLDKRRKDMGLENYKDYQSKLENH